MVDFHERWRGLQSEMGVFGGLSRRLRSVLTELIGLLCGTRQLSRRETAQRLSGRLERETV